MFGRHDNLGTGRSGRLWPVLVVLLATVLVPSAGMLWFMNAAMRNVALAARQIVAEACRSEGAAAADRLEAYWTGRAERLVAPPGLSARQVFGQLVAEDLADGFILRDASGQVVYPTVSVPAEAERVQVPLGLRAVAAMEQDGRIGQAAAAYGVYAADKSDPDIAALAALGQARCLAKAGRKDEAIAVLAALCDSADLAGARDEEGRLIRPNAALFALELMRDASAPAFRAMSDRLAGWLNDYAGVAMASAQRRFLMAALREVDPSAVATPGLEAEKLAATVAAAELAEPVPRRLSRCDVEGVYCLASADGRVIALFRQERVSGEGARAFEAEPIAGVRLVLTPPGLARRGEEVLGVFAAGEALPGWTLRAELTGEDPFAAASRRQAVVYAWTAAAGIVAVVLLAVVVATYIGRQMRLTRLKNDLIATVSHELKTPLSSIRLLVDTLLEDRYRDGQQAKEYFAMIAKENERLSRLIDNFLNFSRMERNRRAFVMEPVTVEEILAAVMRALPERITQPAGQLQLDVSQDCPPISGDRDALVTVVLNLLDNAYKYSRDPRKIVLRAWTRNGRVNVSVSDNGIGLSRRAARRVFERFYQVDSSLSRAAEGCGLGLSIVKFIIEAHGGTVTVASRLGEGSTFTVNLPKLEVMNGALANGRRGANGG